MRKMIELIKTQVDSLDFSSFLRVLKQHSIGELFNEHAQLRCRWQQYSQPSQCWATGKNSTKNRGAVLGKMSGAEIIFSVEQHFSALLLFKNRPRWTPRLVRLWLQAPQNIEVWGKCVLFQNLGLTGHVRMAPLKNTI